MAGRATPAQQTIEFEQLLPQLLFGPDRFLGESAMTSSGERRRVQPPGAIP
ncbi:MAG: hypothetical protein H6669_17640 [Ardenticatenaceae bacterium]|nr:hypothetical protein [Ardenticatenaceae bacterium]